MLLEYVVKKKKKKSRIRETKHLLIDADSSTNTKFTPFMSKSCQIQGHYFLLLFLEDLEKVKIMDIGLQEVGAKRCLNGVNKWIKYVKQTFFVGRFHTLYEEKFSNLGPFLYITFPQLFQKSNKFGNWTFGSGAKRPLNRVKNSNTKKSCSVRQNSPKNKLCFARNFTPFVSKSFQIWDHFFLLLFPKESLKKNWHPILGSWGKKTFKRYLKKWTDKQTDRRTFRLIFFITSEIEFEGDLLRINCLKK